jgi:ketosteroid isomerase-like protein
MSEQANTEVIQSLYAAFGRGDVPFILNCLANQFEWTNPGPVEILPWAKTRRTRDEVVEFFTVLDQQWEFEQFEPREYVAQGDRVVALGYFKARSKKTDRRMEENWAMEWTLSNGKVTRYRAYDDTAAMVAAMQPS